MAGKFEVYLDARGKHRFRLKAGNGQIIAVGESYESMASCLGGIESIRKNAAGATLSDLTSQGPNMKHATKHKAGAGSGMRAN
jgi:hypothetical protein